MVRGLAGSKSGWMAASLSCEGMGRSAQSAARVGRSALRRMTMARGSNILWSGLWPYTPLATHHGHAPPSRLRPRERGANDGGTPAGRHRPLAAEPGGVRAAICAQKKRVAVQGVGPAPMARSAGVPFCHYSIDTTENYDCRKIIFRQSCFPTIR